MPEQTQDPGMRRIYWWSFLLRAGAGLIGWALTISALIPLLQDALGYERLGTLVAQDWLAGRSSVWLDAAFNSSTGREAWLIVVFVAIIYWLMGGLQALPLLIIIYSAVTAFTPVLVYRIAQQLGASPRAARVGAWLVVVSPAFAFWSGALYKEGLILLFLTLGLYHALRLQEKLRLMSLFIIAVCLIALIGLRAYLGLLLSGVILIGLLLGRTTQPTRGAALVLLVRQALIIILFVAALAFVGFTGIAQRILPGDTETMLQQFQSSRGDLASYGSGYLRGTDISTPEQALAFLPMGIFYFITVPWPWDLGPIRQQLIIPEVAFWLALYPLLLVGMVRGLRRNFQGSIVLIAMSVALCVFYALLVGNIGTAYRVRIQVWVLWAVFAGWGLEWFQERRARNRTVKRIPARSVETGLGGRDVSQV